MIEAGTLRHRITILQATSVPNSVGENEDTWKVLYSVSAARKALSLRDVTRSAGTQNSAEAKLEIRYRTGVLPNMRVDFDGAQWVILSTDEIGHREGLALLVRRT